MSGSEVHIMIEVKNLIKTYGDKNAVDGISFSVSIQPPQWTISA